MIRFHRLVGGLELHIGRTHTAQGELILSLTDETLGLLLLGRSALRVQARLCRQPVTTFEASVSLNKTAKGLAHLEVLNREADDSAPVCEVMLSPSQLASALTTGHWSPAEVQLPRAPENT